MICDVGLEPIENRATNTEPRW